MTGCEKAGILLGCPLCAIQEVALSDSNLTRTDTTATSATLHAALLPASSNAARSAKLNLTPVSASPIKQPRTAVAAGVHRMKRRRGYTNEPDVCANCGKTLPVPRPCAEKLCDECDPDKRMNVEIGKLVDQGLSNADVGTRLRLSASAVTARLNRMGKTRPFPKITASQLKQCRLDPVWEVRPENRGIVPADRIVCRECGQLRCDLNCSGGKSHLVRDHQMTPEAYQHKYPAARLTPFARHFTRYAGTKSLQSWLDEFDALYLRPEELKRCRKDSAWEKHHGITEFVVCRCCGLKKKFAISGHSKAGHLISQHGLTFPAYRALFPNAPQMPETERAGRRERHSAWSRSRFKLAKEREKFKPDARGLSALTKARIVLAACLAAEGLSKYKMTDQLNPGPRETFDKRLDGLKSFWRTNRGRYELEKPRVAAIPKPERDAIAAAAREQISLSA